MSVGINPGREGGTGADGESGGRTSCACWVAPRAGRAAKKNAAGVTLSDGCTVRGLMISVWACAAHGAPIAAAPSEQTATTTAQVFNADLRDSAR